MEIRGNLRITNMDTTNSLTREECAAVALATQGRALQIPRESTWLRFKRWVFGCCLGEDYFDDLSFRKATRVALAHPMAAAGETALDSYKQFRPLRMTQTPSVAVCATEEIVEYGERPFIRAVRQPRFVAAAVIELRARLGRLPKREACHLVAERKYLEICRDRGLSQHDVALHQQYVLDMYFSENLYEHLPLTRRRLPKWLQWLVNEPSGVPDHTSY